MKQPFNYGGQAVIEGVMMRGRQAMAVAVRHPSGEIVVHTEPLNRGFYASPWAKRPFIRGVLLLWDTLVLGMKALAYSATVSLDEEAVAAEKRFSPAPSGQKTTAPSSPSPATESDQAMQDSSDQLPNEPVAARPRSAREQSEAAAREAFGGGLIWGTMALALAFGIGLFFISPLLLTRTVEHWLLPHPTISVLVEGLIRIAIFFGYIWLIGRLPDVRRVFAYHGAEHKTINAFEAGEPLVPERVQRYSVAHPRCGTSFLLYVIVLSIFVFGVLGRPSLPVRLATRVAFIPVIASVAYELIRLSGRRTSNPVVKAMLAPGMALQALTTREPDDQQIEVAITALDRVLAIDAAAERSQNLPGESSMVPAVVATPDGVASPGATAGMAGGPPGGATAGMAGGPPGGATVRTEKEHVGQTGAH